MRSGSSGCWPWPARWPGDAPIQVNEAVYRSEKSHATKNRALAYLLKTYGIIHDDVEEVLELLLPLLRHLHRLYRTRPDRRRPGQSGSLPGHTESSDSRGVCPLCQRDSHDLRYV